MAEKKHIDKNYVVDGVLYMESKENIDRIRISNCNFLSKDDFHAKKVRQWFRAKFKDGMPHGMWIFYLDVMLGIIDNSAVKNKPFIDWIHLSADERNDKIAKAYRLIDELKEAISEENFLPIYTDAWERYGDDKWGHRMVSSDDILNNLKDRIGVAIDANVTTHNKYALERECASSLDIFFRNIIKLKRMPNKIITYVIYLKYPDTKITEPDVIRWRYSDKRGRLLADLVKNGIGYKEIASGVRSGKYKELALLKKNGITLKEQAEKIKKQEENQ